VIAENIRMEIAAGKKPSQAVAIAYSHANRDKGRKKQRPVFE
jgi:hypothetical protein